MRARWPASRSPAHPVVSRRSDATARLPLPDPQPSRPGATNPILRAPGSFGSSVRLDSRPSSRSAASANADQVHDEHEGLVGSDRPTGAALAVREHRRDRDPPAAADPHPGHALIPTGDDLALTQAELEGAATVP